MWMMPLHLHVNQKSDDDDDDDLGSRSHKLFSTLYIMWPIQLQSLRLLRHTDKKMHLQENTLFDL